MSLITWEEKLSVGVETFNKEHQKLIQLINTLHEAMRSGTGKLVIGETLNELIKYTQSHFAHEEELMKKYQYPNFSMHKKEHDELTNKVIELNTKFETGEMILTIEVMQFLKDWLTKHILETDKQYGTFFTSKGVK